MEVKIKKSGTRSRYVFIKTDGWEKLTFGKIKAIMDEVWWLHWKFLELRDYATLEAENMKFVADNIGDINPEFRTER